MKRNKLFILGLFFAFVAVLSLTLVSGTWAKYTTTKSASSTARVARWAWEYNGTELSSAPIAFNLFQTILDTKAPSSNEEDVKHGTESEAIIAPGTKGEATITVKNNSEVDATAVITFTITNIGTSEDKIPLKFWVSKNGAVTEITTEAQPTGTYTYEVDLGELVAETSSVQTVVLSWEWKFEGEGVNDAYDTQLASKALDALTKTTVTAEIVFTQVD